VPRRSQEIIPWLRYTFRVAHPRLHFPGVFLLAGCSSNEHPAVKDAVNNALTSNNLGIVSVSQDREKGVITLTGDVESEDKKTLAETLAKQGLFS
jgi:hypothetical protein